MAADEFVRLHPVAKAGLALKLAAFGIPGMLAQMWQHKGQLLYGLVAPYLNPLGSLQAANAAVAASAKEGPVEAILTAIKQHGGLLAAWSMPIALALAPFTGGATLVAVAGTWLGMSVLGGTAVSLVKNTIDAAFSKSRAELEEQANQIRQDGMTLGTAAAAWGATKLVEQGVKFIRSRFGPERPIEPVRTPVESNPEQYYGEIQKKVAPYTDEQMRTMKLTEQPGAKTGGTTPKVRVTNPEGDKFNLKMHPDGSLEPAIEESVSGLRDLAGVPGYRTVRRSMTLADGTTAEGLLKYSFKGQDGLPPADPTKWSPVARANVLDQHPWQSWLLDTDPHPLQYKIMGDKAYAFYGDVDHSFMGALNPIEVTRHGQFPAILEGPEMLYKAYVTGQVDLDLNVLMRSAERIKALPDQAVLARLKPFMDAAFADGKAFGKFATPEAFGQFMLERKANLPAEFAQRIADLKAERAFNLGQGGTIPSWGKFFNTAAWDLRTDFLSKFMYSPLFEPLTELRQNIAKFFGKKG